MVKRAKPSEPSDRVSGSSSSSRSLSPYWSGAHTTHRLRFHLVWVPKYRRRVLEGAIAARLTELLQQACVVNGWELHELSVQPDHVHLLVQIPPRLSVSKVVNLLKGGSSRLLRQEFADLEEFLWGDSFWCDGYFAETVGQTEEGVIRRYIRNQGQGRDE
jgi:putative transposase